MASGGTLSFNREDFFADVINAVNDLHVDGFNAFEEHVAKLLNLSSEADLARVKEAVDAVFLKVQTVADKNFQRWQTYCENNCFYVLERPTTAAEKVPEEEEANATLPSVSTEQDSIDSAKEAELDAELEALRSRILTVRRERLKLHKECRTLEAWLNSKREKVDAVSHAASVIDESKLSAIEAEIARAGAMLRERMKNAELETLEPNAEISSKAAFAKLLLKEVL